MLKKQIIISTGIIFITALVNTTPAYSQIRRSPDIDIDVNATQEPQPTAIPSLSPTSTPAASSTPRPTSTPRATLTATPTATPVATAIASPTPTATPELTPTPTPEATLTPEPTIVAAPVGGTEDDSAPPPTSQPNPVVEGINNIIESIGGSNRNGISRTEDTAIGRLIAPITRPFSNDYYEEYGLGKSVSRVLTVGSIVSLVLGLVFLEKAIRDSVSQIYISLRQQIAALNDSNKIELTT